MARLSIAPHGQVFRVVFPVEVEAGSCDTPGHTPAEQHSFMWLTRCHLVAACPACWQHPLSLARGEWARGKDACVSLRPVPGGTQHSMAQSVHKEQLPQSVDIPSSASQDISLLPVEPPQLSIAGLHAKVLVEIWEDVTCHVLDVTDCQAVFGEVHQQDSGLSCFVCKGHGTTVQSISQSANVATYSATSLPKLSLDAGLEDNRFYRNASRVAQLHQQILAQPDTVCCGETTTRPHCWTEGVSDEVVRQKIVHGTGIFTTYKDGRVRLVHEDRTILEIDSHQMYATGICRNGSTIAVLVAHPGRMEAYVSDALQFKWQTSHSKETIGCSVSIEGELNKIHRRLMEIPLPENLMAANARAYRENEALIGAVHDVMHPCHKVVTPAAPVPFQQQRQNQQGESSAASAPSASVQNLQ